jgi:diguanylate cyclase (GGDEF)-like protein
MNVLRHKKSSFYLILLSAMIFCLGIIMAFLVHVTVKDLHHDARIINEAGIIRGSIQRITKLVLSHSEQNTIEINTDINDIFIRFSAMENSSMGRDSEKELFTNIHRLKKQWLTLEQLLIKYQTLPSERIKNEIISESETCWMISVSVVQSSQLVTEEKAKEIKTIFYLLIILNTIGALFVTLLVILYVRKKLEYETYHDPLTNLYNRRSYENIIDSELTRSKRYDKPFSLIIFDIDNFKSINDKYGHKVGDTVLIMLAKIVDESIRETDSSFRIGGEEFAITCPETKAKSAAILAEKIRNKVAGYPFETVGNVTVSIGIAEFVQDISKDHLFNNADKAMYLAKNKGKNRCEIFSF